MKPTIEFISGNKMPVGDVYCIGRNYAAHAKELNNPVPKEPMVFLKPASSIVSSGEDIILPKQSSDVHHEVEVCVVLGDTSRNMTLEQAEAAIAGYAIGVDVTARDIQQKAKEKGHPWSVAKGFATFAPLGPFVDADAVENHADLSLELRINSEVRQQGNTKDMIFSIPYLISFLSGIFDLQTGDLIFTGTPEGVGPVNNGDRLEAVLGDGLSKVDVKATGR